MQIQKHGKRRIVVLELDHAIINSFIYIAYMLLVQDVTSQMYFGDSLTGFEADMGKNWFDVNFCLMVEKQKYVQKAQEDEMAQKKETNKVRLEKCIFFFKSSNLTSSFILAGFLV